METPIFVRVGDGAEVEVATVNLGEATSAAEVTQMLAQVFAEVAKALRTAGQ